MKLTRRKLRKLIYEGIRLKLSPQEKYRSQGVTNQYFKVPSDRLKYFIDDIFDKEKLYRRSQAVTGSKIHDFEKYVTNKFHEAYLDSIIKISNVDPELAAYIETKFAELKRQSHPDEIQHEPGYEQLLKDYEMAIEGAKTGALVIQDIRNRFPGTGYV